MRRRVLCPALVLLLAVAGPLLAQVGDNQGALNPNLASEQELASLGQLGDEGAATVIAGRPWLSMAALHVAVGAGLSEEQQNELYARLWLPINLNDVTEAEILLIPGVGNRMAHEFEEYRPYAGLAVFRREMGKYVDDDEVARFERYMTIGR